MVKTYWRTYNCQNRIITSGSKSYRTYCKNRFCTVCAGNRKAEVINKYMPVMNKWEDPYFVTLTAKSVKAPSLKKRLSDMNWGLKIILNKYSKRAKRGKGIKLMGIKSLECNYNPIKKTYNPHFHLIVSTKEAADLILQEWLKICTPKFAGPQAQHKRKVKNLQEDFIEVVKYSTKIFTAPDGTKDRAKPKKFIYLRALHNIIVALKERRFFDRFEFNLPKNKKEKTANLSRLKIIRYGIMIYKKQTLSNFVPDPKIVELRNTHFNFDLE
jgi:hypothetical protein